MSMKQSPLEMVLELTHRDPRYPIPAYKFMFEALEYTLVKVTGERRHVTGRELLEGVRLYAFEQFGPLAKMVFKNWGIRNTRDFGNMIFNLIDLRLMGRNETDTVDDFNDIFEIDTVFWEDYYNKVDVKISF